MRSRRPRADAFEIAGHRVTARAPCREIALSCGSVADQHFELGRRDGRRRRPLSRSQREHAMNVGGKRLHIVRSENGCPETILVRTLNDRLNQLAFAIVQHRRHAEQIGTALLAAAKIGTVAPATFRVVNRTAACDYRRVGGIALLRRKAGHTSAPLCKSVRAQKRKGENARTYRTQRT
jgi:hypothetical protein